MRSGEACEKLSTTTGHEHAGRDHEPTIAELSPPQDGLERLPGDAASKSRLEVDAAGSCLEQETGFVLGEDAASGAEPRDELVEAQDWPTWNATTVADDSASSAHSPATVNSVTAAGG